MISIIILNWNGFEDTLECLSSLFNSEFDDYFVVVGDNGSTDNSIDILYHQLKKIGVDINITTYGDETYFDIKNKSIILYDLKNNYGFSKGNNLILKYARHYRPQYYMLLNNDTIVTKLFLRNLIKFKNKKPEYKVLTPLICYYYNKNIIWNGGGKICWGFRKYHYANKKIEYLRKEEFKQCTFITGCCLFFEESIIQNNGNLFSEKFFHGEEDFELAIRLKKNRIKMACVMNSIIYHKVGMSVKKQESHIGPIFIHYLNRIIDMRDNLSAFSFFFYKFLLYLTIIRALYLYNLPLRTIFYFINKLKKEYRIMDCVNKQYCLKIFNNGI